MDVIASRDHERFFGEGRYGAFVFIFFIAASTFIDYFNRTLAKPFKWKFEGYTDAVKAG